MAWAFVAHGTTVTVTATTLTLTEPTGSAAGDLIVACISSRTTATTGVTLPAGWTLVNQQMANNILATTAAVASGCMAYIVRGSSAPSYTFTLPAGISVAMGRTETYRNDTSYTVVDVQTASTTATATTAISVTGLTTTLPDRLIVGMVAGGQEAAINAFNATTPSLSSGTIAQSGAPSATQWQCRCSDITTTGVDTGIFIADAIKNTVGATGNFTATASLGAGHVVIAAAFGPSSTADAWNANDRSANITLSNSDKTTATSTTALGAVRSTQTYTNGTAGKYYAEFVLPAANKMHVGITPTSNALTATTVNFYVNGTTGAVFVNNVNSGTLSVPATNDVICVAWDSGAERVWFRVNAGAWNGSGSADPGSGTGGLDCSFAASTSHALWARSASSAINCTATIRTELAEYTQAVPSGFSSWMGEATAGGGVTVPAVGVSAGSAVGTATVDTVASASFEAAGVAAGSAVGTATVTAVVRADVTVDAVGVAAAAVVGTVTAVGKSNVSTLATGQSATAVAGEASATAKTNISTLATGQAAVSVAGTATVTAGANVSVAVVGVSAAAAVGTPGISSSGAVSVSATSVAAVAAVGDVSIVGVANVTTTGVAASAVVGSPSVSGRAAVTATGVSTAAQTGIASVSTTQIVTVTSTGQAAAALIGGVSVAVGGGISVTPTSVAAAAQVGTAEITAVQRVTVEAAGVIASTEVGAVSASGKANIAAVAPPGSVPDEVLIARLGTVTVATRQTAIVSATGVTATALTGSTSVATGGSVSLTATGVAAHALAGTVAVTALQAATIAPIGQAVTALAGNVLVSGGVSVLADGQSVTANIGDVTITTTGAIGGMNVWTGTVWADKPANVWTGGAWVPKPVRIWNGSVWV